MRNINSPISEEDAEFLESQLIQRSNNLLEDEEDYEYVRLKEITFRKFQVPMKQNRDNPEDNYTSSYKLIEKTVKSSLSTPVSVEYDDGGFAQRERLIVTPEDSENILDVQQMIRDVLTDVHAYGWVLKDYNDEEIIFKPTL